MEPKALFYVDRRKENYARLVLDLSILGKGFRISAPNR